MKKTCYNYNHSERCGDLQTIWQSLCRAQTFAQTLTSIPGFCSWLSKRRTTICVCMLLKKGWKHFEAHGLWWGGDTECDICWASTWLWRRVTIISFAVCPPLSTLFGTVNLKIKTASYFTSKSGLLRKSRELQFGTCELWENLGKSDKGEKCYFVENNEDLGRGCFGKHLGEKWEFRVMMISHWLSCRDGGFLVRDVTTSLFGPVIRWFFSCWGFFSSGLSVWTILSVIDVPVAGLLLASPLYRTP